MDAVYAIEGGAGTYSGKPRKKVTIAESGEIPQSQWDEESWHFLQRIFTLSLLDWFLDDWYTFAPFYQSFTSLGLFSWIYYSFFFCNWQQLLIQNMFVVEEVRNRIETIVIFFVCLHFPQACIFDFHSEVCFWRHWSSFKGQAFIVVNMTSHLLLPAYETM